MSEPYHNSIVLNEKKELCYFEYVCSHIFYSKIYDIMTSPLGTVIEIDRLETYNNVPLFFIVLGHNIPVKCKDMNLFAQNFTLIKNLHNDDFFYISED